MFVIVYMQRVYGPFANEQDAIGVAKHNWPHTIAWLVRPIEACEGI